MSSLSESIFGYAAPDTAVEAIVFRCFELLVVGFALQHAWSWAQYLPRLQEVVMAPGVANYIDVTFLFDPLWAAANAALITACLLVGFFRVHRFGYLAALVLMHLQFVARYSQGKLPHGSNVVGMMLLGLALGAIAFNAPKIQRRFSIAFAYTFAGIGYVSAAVCKMIGTGWHWPDGRHLWMWVQEKSIDAFSNQATMNLNLLQETALDHWWLATAFLTIGLISEIGAIAMIFRPYRIPATAAVLGLHTGVYLIMGIAFIESMVLMGFLLLYPLLLRLDAVLPPKRVHAVYRFAYPWQPRSLSTRAPAPEG